MKHLVVVSLALASGCALQTWGADLRPIARDDRGPIAVTVSAASATEDLLRHADDLADERTTLVLRLHLHNRTAAAASEDPARYRLRVTGADGRVFTGVPVAWAEGELPSGVPEAFPPMQPRTVPLAAGQSRTLAVAFRGLAGLARWGTAQVELLLPDQRTVAISAPTATAPQWTPWRRPRALFLRAGLSWHGDDELTEFGMHVTFTHRRLLFGMSIVDHGALSLEHQVGSYHAGGLGLFVGALPLDWLGVVAGADGLAAQGGVVDGVERGNLWLLRTYGAVRFQAGSPIGAGGGPLPIRRATPSPLRSLVLDVGYTHTFAHGAHPNGGGLLIMVGAPLFAF